MLIGGPALGNNIFKLHHCYFHDLCYLCSHTSLACYFSSACFFLLCIAVITVMPLTLY